MALCVTHIRFASDLREDFKPVDLDKYFSGTIYPDSRYLTGIDRKMTHFEGLLDKSFMSDDFRKGWSAHYLCDKIQRFLLQEKFPALLPGPESPEWWINISALKATQEWIISREFDVEPYIKHISFFSAPIGEDIEDVQKYFQIISRACKPFETVREACDAWKELGVEEEQVKKIANKCSEILADGATTSELAVLYPEMIRRAKIELKNIL